MEIDELFKEANTITLTTNERLNVDETVPSTAVCTTYSMTRRLLFQWVYDLVSSSKSSQALFFILIP